MSLSHPHSSPVYPHANGPLHQLPPFIHKEKRDLVFFLEYPKNERLYLGEFQRGRACFLRHDGAASAREGSQRACHRHGGDREELGPRGHLRFSRGTATWSSCGRPPTVSGSRAQTPHACPPLEENPVSLCRLLRTEPGTLAGRTAGPQGSYIVVGKRLEAGFSEAACL